jgi:hypothetical protein
MAIKSKREDRQENEKGRVEVSAPTSPCVFFGYPHGTDGRLFGEFTACFVWPLFLLQGKHSGAYETIQLWFL